MGSGIQEAQGRDAQAGEKVTLKVGPSHDEESVEYEVLESCIEEDGQEPCQGHWACATHPQALVNPNIALANHVAGRDRGKYQYDKPYANCVIVWICHKHGPEAP